MRLNIINSTLFEIDAMTWTEILSQHNASAVDTGFIDMTGYRWADIHLTGTLGGTGAIEMQCYDPDGSLSANSCQGTAGFFNGNTFYENANQSQFNITFGQSVGSASGNFGFGMRFNCSPANRPSGGTGTAEYYFVQRRSYNCTYCHGTLYWCDGFTDTSSLGFFNGFKFTTNSYSNVLLSVYGAGDNTT